MPVTFVRAFGTAAKSGAVSIGVAVPATIPAGDLLVVLAAYGNTSQSSFSATMASDNSGGGNTWTRQDQRQFNNGNGVAGIAWSVLAAQLTTSHTITVSGAGGTGNWAVTILQFSSVDSAPYDVLASAAPASTTAVDSGFTATTSVADSVVVAATITNGPSGDSVSSPTDGQGNTLTLPTGGKQGTSGGGATTNVTVFGYYYIQSANATRKMLGTLSTARNHYSVAAVFKGIVATTDFPVIPRWPHVRSNTLIRM